MASDETAEEKGRRIGVPVIPKRKRMPIDPNPVMAVCGECNREVRAIEWYACVNSNCPMKPQVTW